MTKKTMFAGILLISFFLLPPQMALARSKDAITNRACAIIDARTIVDPKASAGSNALSRKIFDGSIKNIKELVRAINAEFAPNTPLEFVLFEAHPTTLDASDPNAPNVADPRYDLKKFRDICRQTDGIVIVFANRQRELKDRKSISFLKWNDSSEAWGEIFLYGASIPNSDIKAIVPLLLRHIARLYGAEETEIPNVNENFWTDNMKTLFAKNQFRNWAKTPLY